MKSIQTSSFAVFVVLCFCPQFVSGSVQESDEEKSSRREVAAIETIEQAGGKVYKISAADDSREISCYLSSNPIKDDHLKNVGAIGNVIWMNLAGTEITSDGLKFLVGMPLTKLHLERTKIDDEGLLHLKSMEKLEYLNLYGTKVTDAGLEHLKGLKNLKKLFVWRTGVTDEGMRQLNESLPKLQIVGEVKLNPVVMEEPKAEIKQEKEAKSEESETKTNEETEGEKSSVDQKSENSDKTDDGKGKIGKQNSDKKANGNSRKED